MIQCSEIMMQVEVPTLDPLVITAVIGSVAMKRILTDYESSINILFKKTYD